MRKFLNLIALMLMLAVFFLAVGSVSAQEATAINPFPTAVVTAVQEPQTTPEVTPVPDNPEFNDQLAALEAANNAIVERVSIAALDRFALWGIAVFIIIGILSGIGYFLLWNSNPNNRAEIKTSALKQLQAGEDQVDLRLVKARETPQITDDLGYAVVKLFFDKLESLVAALPVTPLPPESGAVQGTGTGSIYDAQG